jgi:hypothetical protein
MNQKNLDYLKDQVKFTGFGDELEAPLKATLEKGATEFALNHNSKFSNDDVASLLHFKKSAQTDMYFFNRYDVTLKPQGSKDDLTQTFYINKGNNITLKEAYNLMNGRAVNKDLTTKEGQFYNAWVQMDFKQADSRGNYKLQHFHQNYGYDLKAALEKHPIKELSNEQDKERLIASLQKGNLQSVTFLGKAGAEQKHFVEASPQFKTVNIYDSNMQRLSTKRTQDEKEGQGEKTTTQQRQGQKEDQPGDADSSDEVTAEQKKKKKQQSNSMS